MKKVKNIIAGILYRFIVIAVKLIPAKKGKEHLLLIKPDEIGDYILFRNLLKYIRTSDRYKNYKITMIGNIAWKSIFDVYDKDTIDDGIWINKKDFNRKLKYRFSLLKQVRLLQTSEVINCIYSRSIVLDDGFAYVAKGDNKFATERDNANAGQNSINIDKFIYTKIVAAGNERIFDSIRNSRFLEAILGKDDLPVNSKLPYKPVGFKQPQKAYMLFSLGAGNPERKWPIEYFVKCAEYANSKYHIIPLLCGGVSDVMDAEKFITAYGKEVYNYVNKTSLAELIDLLNGAVFVISVDSGPVHMAAACDCNTIGLYSGKYYKRYAPYPKEVSTNFHVVYPDFIDKLIAEQNDTLFNPFVTKNNTIKLIPAEKVLPIIDEIMSNKQK